MHTVQIKGYNFQRWLVSFHNHTAVDESHFSVVYEETNNNKKNHLNSSLETKERAGVEWITENIIIILLTSCIWLSPNLALASLAWRPASYL